MGVFTNHYCSLGFSFIRLPDRPARPGLLRPRSFRPAGRINRVEVATIFGRALVRLGVEPESRYFYLYEDREEIPAWAGDAAAAIKTRVLLGVPGWRLAKFQPLRSTSERSEARVIVGPSK